MDAYLLAALLWLGLHVALTVITALKGKPWFAVLGFFIGWFHIFGAIRLAKPSSWWARNKYASGSVKMNKARARHEGVYATSPASY